MRPQKSTPVANATWRDCELIRPSRCTLASMGHKISGADYGQFVVHAFDHPVSERGWDFDPDSECWGGDAALTAGPLTRLFEEPEIVIGIYAAGQIEHVL